MLLLDFMGSVAPGLIAAPIAMEYSMNTVFQRRQHSPNLLIHLCKTLQLSQVACCPIGHVTKAKREYQHRKATTVAHEGTCKCP